ncbi:MAG: sulfatase-like hydrolase/transferase [Longimicrobiales bacterium]
MRSDSFPLLLTFGLVACTSSGGARVGSERPPNVVYILADDLGYGDLRCYQPDSKIPTPHLDRLASEGARFTDAHSPSAVCTPTRYGILTGRYCWRTTLKKSVLWSWDPPLIEPDRLTVPAFLREYGYQTACIGKWHLGWDWPILEGGLAVHGGPGTNADLLIDFRQPITGGPLATGFDHYFGDDVTNFPPYCFIEDEQTVGIPTVLKPSTMFGAPGPMLPGWKLEGVMPELASRAVRYIEERAHAVADEPFFLYLPLTAPHTPIAPAASFSGASEAGPYGDYVAQVDDLVGQVLKALARAGLEDDTLVIFTSDNGSPASNGDGMSGTPGSVLRDHGHNPNAPWRGMKADIFEGGHRVPFLVRWPGHVRPASVKDEVICHTDLFATLADILGAELPPDAAEDSFSLLSVLEGRDREHPIREATVHHSITGMFGIRQGDWKLILGLGSGGWTKPARVTPQPGEPQGQLYDLASDPGESRNLYSEHPEVVLRLTRLLERYHSSGRSTPGGSGND